MYSARADVDPCASLNRPYIRRIVFYPSGFAIHRHSRSDSKLSYWACAHDTAPILSRAQYIENLWLVKMEKHVRERTCFGPVWVRRQWPLLPRFWLKVRVRNLPARSSSMAARNRAAASSHRIEAPPLQSQNAICIASCESASALRTDP